MTLATLSHHDPNCTGCPACSALAAAILRNPLNPILTTAMGNARLRELAERELRHAEDITHDYEPLDPYEPHLRQLRGAERGPKDDEAQLRAMADFRTSVYGLAVQAQARTSEAFTPKTGDVYANPPDPYIEALRLRKENR